MKVFFPFPPVREHPKDVDLFRLACVRKQEAKRRCHMTSRKVFSFFRGGAFTEDDNRTFWTKSHKFGCILFNRTIVMVYDRGEQGLELARMISFKDVSTLVSFANGDFFIGQKSAERHK